MGEGIRREKLKEFVDCDKDTLMSKAKAVQASNI